MTEIIAEVANAHDGSLGLAHSYIDAAHRAGADTVKFQTHIAEAESTPSEPWRVPFSRQDASRYDYWKRIEFKEHEWQSLKVHAEAKGLKFLSSPFSVAAFELLQRIGCDRWKVASGEVNNTRLVHRIAATCQPVFLSTGLIAKKELDWLMMQIFAEETVTLMRCVSQYPTPPEVINTHTWDNGNYFAGWGVSDHSGTIFPSLLAAFYGAEAVEVHFVLTREMHGPDVSSSITTTELADLVRGVRFIERMGKETYEPSEDMRRIFMTRDEQGRKIGAA